MASSWFGGVALYVASLWCSICGICKSWARWLASGERRSIAELENLCSGESIICER
jgi:hypothetical protein